MPNRVPYFCMAFPLQLIRIFGTESALYEEFAVKCFRIYLLTNFLGGVQLSCRDIVPSNRASGEGHGGVAGKTGDFLYPGYVDSGKSFRLDRHTLGRADSGGASILLSGCISYKRIEKNG